MSGSSFATQALGEAAAIAEFSRWGWAFRLQPVADFGIDAHVEPFDDGEPSGRLIALQLKAGPSYFREEVDGGWVYREGDDKHLRYWLRHSLPVILLLHNPDAGLTYWAHIATTAVTYTDAGWKILVPSAQVLAPQAIPVFAALAESAPGAADDPLEHSCGFLPPSAAQALRTASPAGAAGALRLAALLAAGRSAPDLTARSVLSAKPSWLPAGEGRFETAVAFYATEHGHPDIAAEAYAQAAAYSQPPDARLLACAALAAAEAGDAAHARTLAAQIRSEDSAALMPAIAVAFVRHLGQQGPPPVPDVVARADQAALAAEPASLAFLAIHALHRQDASTAVRYLEEGCSALPDSTAFMLKLATALEARVISGQSPVEADDLRRMAEMARAALEQRRRWSGPGAEALAVLIRRHMLADAFRAAALLATVLPEGGATEEEACADEIVALGTQAAVRAKDRELAREISSRAGSEPARTVVRALTADPDLPATERAELWRAVLADDALEGSWLLALHQLACLGTWPLPELDALHEAGVIDDMYRDLLAARAIARRGELPAAIATLRSYAARSPAAAEILVDVLQEAGRYDEALDEATRSFDRFGESVLGHKRLNLLILAGRADDAAADAFRLLARADTAPELRMMTRRRLIIHYASTGNWGGVEEQARAALGEFPGTADFQWDLIAATLNQGRLQRANDLLGQLSPEIITAPNAQLWFSLRMYFGLSPDDVTASLDMLDRWKDDTELAGQILTGLSTADSMLRPDGTPVLTDMEPDTLQRFHHRFAAYTADNPEGPIQPFHGDARQFLDMLRAQQAALQENTYSIARHIQAGQAPLSTLAAFLGRSYTRDLLQRNCGMLLAVTPDPAPFASELSAAQAALDHPVVIETSAIVVATTLPSRWPRLRGAFTEVRITRDAWNDIYDARQHLLREPGTVFSVSFEPGRAPIQPEATAETHEHLARRFAEIGDAMTDITLITAPDLGTLARYTFGSTNPALSPLAACAATGAALWSDDVAVRAIAAQCGVPAFGTIALLHVLVDNGWTEDTLREDVLAFARSSIGDLMLTADELTSLAAENSYQPGPATLILSRPLYWASPAEARAQFLELVGKVNKHAPSTLPVWLQAACAGLAIRQGDARDATSLAEAAAAQIQADDEVAGHLIDVSKTAAAATQPSSSGS